MKGISSIYRSRKWYVNEYTVQNIGFEIRVQESIRRTPYK